MFVSADMPERDGWHWLKRHSPSLFAVLLCAFLPFTQLVVASDNPPPVQTFYIPIPENHFLQSLKTIVSNSTVGAEYKPVDPMYNYISVSVFSDNTLIYYDHWENGFDASVQEPLNRYAATNLGGTQIWGDNNPTNGMPPGFASDVLNYGSVILLENSVVSSNRTVINFDAGDKIAATKPIAVTRAGWASGSATLLAGANEVFDTVFWGTYFLAPVGVNIPDATDFQQFEYVGFSVMAGVGGATVEIDKDANGVYETTNVLSEGEGLLVDGGVRVGGQVRSDRPVQVDMITADIFEGFESRFMRLLPVELWSSSSTTPVSTPSSAQGYTGNDTTVWLYNPATNSITVNYVTRTGAGGNILTTTVLTVPGGSAGGYLKQVIPNGYGARFINTNGLPFHALACIDSTGTTLSPYNAFGSNRTWDWGFTLVPEDSLTSQVLVGLGIGRDPTSSVNPSENASPIWVTPVGNANTSVTVYVDYDADPTTGPLTDPGGYQYDAAYSARELDRLMIYNPSGDQSGMLIYVLDDGIKLAAAWGSDPALATPGQPGLDMGTAIPPLPLFVANKRSFLITDVDNDGYISPGDILEYRIIIENTGRQPVPDLGVQDLLPASLIYLTNTTFFVNASSVTSAVADNATPPASTRFPLDEGGITLSNSLPVGGIWQVIYKTRVDDFTNLPPGTVELQNQAIVGGVGLVHSNTVTTPIRGRIGDYVWWDTNADGLQSAGETGVNGATVRLLTTNGTPVLDDIGVPITAVTTNDGLGNPGYYRLVGVQAGDYIVEFVNPSGYIFTVQDTDSQGLAGTNNSDAAIPLGRTASFTLAGGETKVNVDAGLVEASSVGDFAWFDVTGDGLQSPGEPGINGVTVNLLNTNGTPVLGQDGNPISVVTANDGGGNPGYYRFDNLYAGSYIVEFVLPANAAFTAQNADGQGTGGVANSDANITTGRTPVFTLAAAQALTAIDAGVLRGDLVLTKTGSVQAASEGGSITYSVTVSNAGPTRVTGITVNDMLPSGLTYVTNAVSQGTYNSGTGDWTIGTMLTGSTVHLSLQATVNAGTMNTAITNTAQITAADMPDPTPANNQQSAVLAVSALKITKTSDVAVSVQPGGVITYTIVVTNSGAQIHSGLSVLDLVPVGTTYVPGSRLVTLFPQPPTTTIVYTANSTFNVPAGVTSVTVEAWGGAGGGGRARGRPSTGGGGAGGAYARKVVVVTPLGSYTVTVGAGGIGGNGTGTETQHGRPGNPSWFGTTNTIFAQGGARGLSDGNVANGNGLPGSGSSALSVGDLVYRGGNGSQGLHTSVSGYSGAGGGGAGSTGNGGDAAAGTGGSGTLQFGGNGANGVGNSTPGANGSVYGGGGSGGKANNFTDRNGGAGANGRVSVTYQLPGIGVAGDPPALASGYTMMPGQTLTLSFSVTVDDPLALMAITNTASVTSILQTVAIPASVVDLVIPVDLALAKTADPTTVNEGDPVVFTVTITNRSAVVAATAVAVSDVVPVGFNLGSAVPSVGSYNSGSGLWTVGTLNAGAAATLTLNVTAEAGSGGYWWTNTATITASEQVDTNTANNIAQAVVLVRGADLAIQKIVNNPAPNEEDTIVYSVVVSNRGPSQATGVVVSEPLTNGITYVTNLVSQGSYNSGSGVWTVGTLAAGSAATLTITATVDPGTVGTYITNISRITASDLLDPAPGNNSDQAVIAVSGLRVIKTSNVSGMTYPGSNITYTIVVTNLGFTAHTGIAVTDLVPAGTVHVSGSVPPTLTNGLTLLAGQSVTLQMTVQVVNPCTLTQIVNVASVVSDQQTVPITAMVVDPVAHTDLAVLKTVSDSNPDELDGVTYTVVVTNRGSVTASGVVVSDLLPVGVTYSGHGAGQGAYNSGTGDWAVGTILVGASAQLTINATVNAGTAGTAITNQASLTAAGVADPVTSNNMATAVITVVAVDIGVGKSVDTLVPFEKENVVYTVSVTNFGPDAATGVVVTDLLPSGLDYVSHGASTGTYVPASGVWSVGGLGVGQVRTLTLTAKVQVGMAGKGITNTVTMTTVDQVDVGPGNHTDSVVVTPEEPPLGIFKTSNVSGFVSPGGTITYTILVTNQSSQMQTGITVTDPLPSGVSYVPGSTEVYGPVVTNDTFLDQFAVRQYTNNNGTLNWSGNWVETGDDNNPDAGSIRIAYDSTRGVADTLRVSAGSRSITRVAGLSGTSSANLSFVYRRDGLEAGEFVAVEIASNGIAGTFTELGRFQGAATDASYRSTNYNVTAWRSANTAIRFRTTVATMDNSDTVWFDDVQVAVPVREYVNQAGSAPSNLVSGRTLAPGEWMTVTYQVTVTNPPTQLAITNVARVTSTQMATPVSATRVDAVEHVDLRLWKVVNDLNPGTNEVIEYQVVVTNAGPQTASGIVIRESWPSDVIYSNGFWTQGAYDVSDPSNHYWTVGSLAVGQSATLFLTGVVNVTVSMAEITNRAEITARNQYDRWTENDSDSVAIATLVVLSRVESGVDERGVFVEWETASEIGTAGFHLERVRDDGAVERLTRRLLPAVVGHPQGGVYRYYTGSGPVEPASCNLVELERSGRRNVYGPYAVMLPVPGNEAAGIFESTPRRSSSSEQRLEVMRASPQPVVPAPRMRLMAWGGTGGGGSLPEVKLDVDRPGLYRVRSSDLADLLGVMDSVIRTHIQGGQAALFNRGERCAVWPVADGSALYWYGETVDSPYTDVNRYWLKWEAADLMASRDAGSPAPVPVPSTFRDTIRFEDDRLPAPGLAVLPSDDYWMWALLIADSPVPGSTNIGFSLASPDAAGADARLSVRLHGTTATGVADEHHARILVNGTVAGDIAWSALLPANAVFSVPAAALSNGVNRLTVEAILEDGVDYSLFFLDSFEVEYDRFHENDDGQIVFTTVADGVVTVRSSADTNLVVLAVSNPLQPQRMTGTTLDWDAGKVRVSLDAAASNRYLAATLSAAHEPVAMNLETVSDLGAVSNRADYLVITVPSLLTGAQALANYRAERGLVVRVVLLEDVYDEFSDGNPDPRAIRDFIQFAREEWAVGPSFVLLAGAGTYDYRDLLGHGDCLIPAVMTASMYGLSASDNWYADADEDGVPRVALGRVPAVTSDELIRYLDKVKQYEQGPRGYWRSHVVLLADDKDEGGDFRAVNEQIRRNLPIDVSSETVYLDEEDLPQARWMLQVMLEFGAGFVNYVGHAGVDRLASEGLLTGADALALSNTGMPTVVTAMGCVLGMFDVPGYDSLAETLVVSATGGAVAVWAPSGMALNDASEVLGRRLYDRIMLEREMVFGQAIQHAMHDARQDPKGRQVLDRYVLLGDPALILPGLGEGVFPYALGDTQAMTIQYWRNAVFTQEERTNALLTADDADPDGDGFVNWVEYLVGCNPLQIDGLTVLRMDSAQTPTNLAYDAEVTFVRRKAVNDGTMTVEISDDLANWQSGTGVIVDTTVQDDGNGQTETVTVQIRNPDENSCKGFVRLMLRLQ